MILIVVISVIKQILFDLPKMKNFKESIIDEYKKLGSPMSIEKFLNKYKEELSQASCTLSEMPLLDNMFHLSFEQAYELIEYYGKGFLFSSEIEENIYSLKVTSDKIEIIENKAKRKNKRKNS